MCGILYSQLDDPLDGPKRGASEILTNKNLEGFPKRQISDVLLQY